MRRSPAWRFFIVGILVVLMFVPLFMVGQIIDERARYNRSTRSELGMEWGGQQSIRGPYMIVPIEETSVEKKRIPLTDPSTGQPLHGTKGEALFEIRTVSSVQQKSIYVFPKKFDASIDSHVQERRKGIFEVPVYSSDIDVDFDFDLSGVAARYGSTGGQIEPVSDDAFNRVTNAADVVDEMAIGQPLITSRVIQWDAVEIRVRIHNIIGMRGTPTFTVDDKALKIEPISSDGLDGFKIRVGDPRGEKRFHLSLTLNGAEQLTLDALGAPSKVVMTGDWPHPNFAFSYLPDSYEVTNEGYEATWSIPRLARGLPEVSERYDAPKYLGVKLYQPNDFYQQSYRAARYGILFIALSFLTIYLIEGQTRKPAHPVQYILVGLAQSVFFLMLLAFAEQLGFSLAYLISAGATVVLITLFGAAALKLGKRTLVLGALLAVLYGVLYLILRSTDYALLAGSLLLFAAVAGTMFATKDQDWYQAPAEGEKRGRSWFGKQKPVPAPEPGVTKAPKAQPQDPDEFR